MTATILPFKIVPPPITPAVFCQRPRGEDEHLRDSRDLFPRESPLSGVAAGSEVSTADALSPRQSRFPSVAELFTDLFGTPESEWVTDVPPRLSPAGVRSDAPASGPLVAQ